MSKEDRFKDLKRSRVDFEDGQDEGGLPQPHFSRRVAKRRRRSGKVPQRRSVSPQRRDGNEPLLPPSPPVENVKTHDVHEALPVQVGGKRKRSKSPEQQEEEEMLHGLHEDFHALYAEVDAHREAQRAREQEEDDRWQAVIEAGNDGSWFAALISKTKVGSRWEGLCMWALC